MKRKIALFAALAALAACAKTFSWRITCPQPVAQTFAAYRGETLEFAPQFCGAMSNVTASALYYQTNGMGTAWWQADGLRFAPSNDCGAAAYRFFVRAADPLGTDYTANGVLRMLDSPGETPNALPLPVQVLDFAAVEVANAPWPDAEDVAAAAREAADAATNYTDRAVAAATNAAGRCDTAAPSWQVPGDWRVGYLLRTSQESSVFKSLSTNAYYQVFSNVTESAETTLAAVLYPVVLDRLSAYAPTGVTYYAVSPGVTIAGNVATAATGGVYRVCAEDPATGAGRYVDLPLDYRTHVGATVRYYFTDAEPQ